MFIKTVRKTVLLTSAESVRHLCVFKLKKVDTDAYMHVHIFTYVAPGWSSGLLAVLSHLYKRKLSIMIRVSPHRHSSRTQSCHFLFAHLSASPMGFTVPEVNSTHTHTSRAQKQNKDFKKGHNKSP